LEAGVVIYRGVKEDSAKNSVKAAQKSLLKGENGAAGVSGSSAVGVYGGGVTAVSGATKTLSQ
jgi:hypothetical protein